MSRFDNYPDPDRDIPEDLRAGKLKIDPETISERAEQLAKSPDTEIIQAEGSWFKIDGVSVPASHRAGKDENQDQMIVFAKPDENFFLAGVFDGVGGKAGGRQAAETFKTEILAAVQMAVLRKFGSAEIYHAIQGGIKRAQTKIKTLGPEYQSADTTISLMYGMEVKLDTGEKQLKIFTMHTGDSRIYRFRNSQKTQITADQSPVEELKIDPLEAKLHPRKNEVYSTAMHPDFKYYSQNPQPQDVYLLNTDGFSDQFREDANLDEIQNMLGQEASALNMASTARVRFEQKTRLSKNDDVTIIRVIIKNPPKKTYTT